MILYQEEHKQDILSTKKDGVLLKRKVFELGVKDILMIIGIIGIASIILALLFYIDENNVVSYQFNPLMNKKIVIDPGHGGVDGGANTNGFLEKEINLAFAKILQKELTGLGAEVVLSREEDISLEKQSSLSSSRYRRDLHARKCIIEGNKPDIFISIHVNCHPSRPRTSGFIAFYSKDNLYSKQLANSIQYYVNETMEKYNLPKHSPEVGNFYLLGIDSVPGIIAELGFLSNPKEREMLKDARYQMELSKSLIEGLKQYFSLVDYRNIDSMMEEIKSKNSI